MLLPFLTFVNYESPYLTEGFLHNPCPCFDIPFARLGVIQIRRNKFAEIVAVAECHLITNHVKNKESKKQPFRICVPVKLADGKMSIKKEKNYSYLMHSIVSLGRMAGKPFSLR